MGKQGFTDTSIRAGIRTRYASCGYHNPDGQATHNYLSEDVPYLIGSGRTSAAEPVEWTARFRFTAKQVQSCCLRFFRFCP